MVTRGQTEHARDEIPRWRQLVVGESSIPNILEEFVEAVIVKASSDMNFKGKLSVFFFQ